MNVSQSPLANCTIGVSEAEKYAHFQELQQLSLYLIASLDDHGPH